MCLGIAWLTSLGGLSLALGAFIAGLVISESEYSHQAIAEVLPFRDSFNSCFCLIGILMDWHILLEYPLVVTGVLLVVCSSSSSPERSRVGFHASSLGRHDELPLLR